MAKKIAKGKGWSITATNDGALKFLGTAPPRLEMEIEFAMRDVSYDIPAEVIKGMSDYKGGARSPSDPLQVRTGKLAQTVRGHKTGSGADTVAHITAGSSTVPYAGVQEYGDTIRPKKAKYLRVPLSDILTDRGAVKGEYEIVERASGGYSTAGGNPTWISGRAIMVMENGKPRPIWALMTEAKIPPRLGMGTTIDKRGPWIRDRLLEAVQRAVVK